MSLEELRQVAEKELTKTDHDDIEVKTTNCLGVCKPGHVMGFADQSDRIYIFNGMDNPESVRELVQTVIEGSKQKSYSLSADLSDHLEGKLDPGDISKIPFHDD